MSSVGWRVYGFEPDHREHQRERGLKKPAPSSEKRGKPQALSGVFTTGYKAAEEHAQGLRDMGYTVTGIEWTGSMPPKSGRG
jgi:hypothetical protein